MDFAHDTDYKAIIKSQDYSKLQEKSDKAIEYDYKIISFRIGNEYYGIDIMRVNSILKNDKFTMVPNVLDFVIGVFSLRGKILPIIDLAKMFHLESQNKGKVRSIIIVKVDSLLIGVAVDQIQHVIPLRKNTIQPPSPLLGSINERFIEGVVEVNSKLCVILNTNAIFSDKEKSKKEILPQSSDLTEEFFAFFTTQIEEFCNIHIYGANKSIMRVLFEKYMDENNISNMPKINEEVAKHMFKKIISKHTGKFWLHPYTDQFMNVIKPKINKICSDEISVLNIGCADGHETFSVYFLLAHYYKDVEIKMLAADSNLMSVSNASRLEEKSANIPSWIDKNRYFTNISDDIYKVKKEIIDKIYFEFHNAVNISTYKKTFDLVVVRNLSLYLKETEFHKFIEDMSEMVKKGGVLILGDNETITESHFEKINDEYISAYYKI